MAKRKDKTRKVRLGIVAGAAAVAVIVIGFGLFYGGMDDQPYRTLDRPNGTGDVKVVTYFSYLCPHCRNLEEVAEGWAETLPAGTAFERVHIAGTATTRLLAKGYLALARHGAVDANHERIFRAIQDHGRSFASAEALADFVDGHGIDRSTFLRTFASTRIARAVEANERNMVDQGITGVPAMVVDGKYVINMALGRKQALATAADLAGDLVAQRSASQPLATNHLDTST